jgi:hypothetical protein
MAELVEEISLSEAIHGFAVWFARRPNVKGLDAWEEEREALAAAAEGYCRMHGFEQPRVGWEARLKRAAVKAVEQRANVGGDRYERLRVRSQARREFIASYVLALAYSQQATVADIVRVAEEAATAMEKAGLAPWDA